MRSTVGCRSIVIVSALLSLALSACGGGASIGATTTFFLPYWQYRASMPTPRAFLAATVGLDGRTYVFGGEVNTGTAVNASDSVDAYTPATDTWTAGVSQLPTNRRNIAAVTGRNGLIYTIGGLDLQNQPGPNVIEAYNPNIKSWTCSTGDLAPGCASSTLAPQPTPLPMVATVGLDGRIYTFPSIGPTRMEVYDPDTNTWTCSMGDAGSGCSAMSLAPVPNAYLFGVYSAATGPDGRIYVIADDVYGGVFKAYDPGSNTWTCSTNDPAPSGCYAKTLAPPPHHGDEGSEMAVAADSSIFLIGGFGNTQNPTTKVDAYDTGSNTWSPIAPMNTSRAFAAAVRGSDGYIYAIGGFSPTECDQCHVASMERYVAARPGLTPTPLHTPFPQVDPTPPCLVCSGAATPTHTHPAQPTPTHVVQPTPTHVVQPTPTPTPSCRVVFSGSVTTITSTTSYLDLTTGQTSGSQTGGDALQWSTAGPAPIFDALNGTQLGDLSTYSAASCATLEGLTYPKSTEPASNGETFAAKLANGDLAKVQVSLPGTEPYPMLQVVTYAP